MTTENPLFDNSRLINAAGAVDTAFIAASAKARAQSLYGDDCCNDDIAYWTEKLTGMAQMLSEQHAHSAARQLIAVASLLGHCDALCSSGSLSEPFEQSLRILIVNTERAFGMPTRAERVS